MFGLFYFILGIIALIYSVKHGRKINAQRNTTSDHLFATCDNVVSKKQAQSSTTQGDYLFEAPAELSPSLDRQIIRINQAF
jgi:hypothetical protein